MQEYCNSLTRYQRLKTLPVNIGDLVIGNLMPIAIQTMTTTDTMDNKSTVAQTIRCIEAGADLVRITAPSIKEATHLQIIRKELESQGYKTPLVADIHFTPNAAEIAARIVQKVRINPGNYADKKKFEFIEYTDATYKEELERIHQRFLPLIKICKEYGTAMRIGTNHGSLSDRIMSRYGDTPMGMVQSALEFLDFCEAENYKQVVLSMKASNPQVMIQAYRLLVSEMNKRGSLYPLHLGVTEAGDGIDGRVKSAIGIGSLLEDGLGDTIRVSLTEDPELELPVCKALVSRYNLRQTHGAIPTYEGTNFNPYQFQKYETKAVNNIGGSQVPVVVSDFSERELIKENDLIDIGYVYNADNDKWHIQDMAADYLFTGNLIINFALPGTLKTISHFRSWWSAADKTKCFPYFSFKEYALTNNRSSIANFVCIDDKSMYTESKKFFNQIRSLSSDHTIIWIIESEHVHHMAALRRMFLELREQGVNQPVIMKSLLDAKHDERVILSAATDIGSLFIDGMGDGLWLQAPHSQDSLLCEISFNILQATRMRISKTEYISCPSCGRTLFDLQETTAAIRAKTSHLKGVKIAIMGCIVNGPGEMADADFGYVGSGVGKITLYKGKDIVERNIDSEVAVEALVNLLKTNNVWVEPSIT